MFTKCVNIAAHHCSTKDQLLRKHWKDKQMVHNGEVRASYKHNIYRTIQKNNSSVVWLVVCWTPDTAARKVTRYWKEYAYVIYLKINKWVCVLFLYQSLKPQNKIFSLILMKSSPNQEKQPWHSKAGRLCGLAHC